MESNGHKIKFAIARGPFNLASFLMGTTEFLMALKIQPDDVNALLVMITDFLVDWLRLQKSTFDSIDGIFLLDDIVGFVGPDDFKSMATSSRNGAVLLGVCGGRNSEGEDYPGDHMNSVVIAGFPYHMPTPRVEAKIQYYDKVFSNQGWNFAYLYPAIQRANQASGRPIRKISDKGAIIFMDSRFKTKYKWISEWVREELEIIPDKPEALIRNLTSFWKAK